MFPYGSTLLCTPPHVAGRQRRRRRWVVLVASETRVEGPLVVYAVGDNGTRSSVSRMAMAKRRRRNQSLRDLTRSRQSQSLLVQGLLDSHSSPLQCLLNRCNQWDFDSFLLSRVSEGHPVVSLGQHLFQVYDFQRVFRLDPSRALHLLRLMEDGYAPHKFHSATHSADVAQAMHCFLSQSKISATLTLVEKLACILSAFGHDLYHPGVNQKFLESSNNFLCTLYGNVSVLENFHWRCLVSMVRESGLVDHWSPPEWKSFIDLCGVLILATDMQRQQEYLNQFQVFLSEPQRDLSSLGCRRRLMQILIKCADIGNPCRPWAISREWSHRASSEFFLQGDRERRLGYPVTSFCDRNATSVPKIQSGFMQFVAEPLFSDWNSYMGTTLSQQLLNNLQSNCAQWTNLLKCEIDEIDARGRQSPDDEKASPAKSSLDEVAELELQLPEVLRQRRVSASVLLTTPFRHNRRPSLPVSSLSVTSWTIRSVGLREHCVSLSQSMDVCSSPPPLRLHPPLALLSQLHSTLQDLPEVDSGRSDHHAGKENYSAIGRRRHSAPQVVPLQSLTLAPNLSPRLNLLDTTKCKFPRRGSMPLSRRQLEALQPLDSLHSMIGVS